MDIREGRDAPPHTAGVQLLQKPSNGQDTPFVDDAHPRSRIFGDHEGLGSPHDGGRFGDREMTRRDNQPYGNRGTDSARPRDHHYSQEVQSPISPPDQPRRMSQMGPPLPPHSSHELRDGRQVPPHLSGAHPPPGMWRSPSMSDRPRRLSTASSVSQAPASTSPQALFVQPSPAMQQATLPVTSPIPLQGESTLSMTDLNEARKAAMHSAAERARLRRQQEEEERERERERARKKAAELEAKLEAAKEKEKVQKKETEAEVCSTTLAHSILTDLWSYRLSRLSRMLYDWSFLSGLLRTSK
jgi:hypothetical protein